MNIDEFRKHGHEIIEWIASYYENLGDLPVLSQVKPGEIFEKFEDNPPDQPVPFEKSMAEFNEKIIPGITHWQHPSFFAYFPASSSFPSILGEMLTSALAAQCMVWQTSPAAAELEAKTMNWLRQMIGLPYYFEGVIQDTASTATLCSILSAREKYSDYTINSSGFGGYDFTVYCSSEAHSSIEKAVKIAGIGKANLRKIPVKDDFSMETEALENQIEIDLINGYTPLCIVAALGTTGSTAVDDLRKIGEIAEMHNIWLHVDAAFAGTALLLDEFRHYIDGIEFVDTFVFNPHKWMLTNFDCSAYFVKNKEVLIRTFEIMPEYLKTGVDSLVNNYRDWGIQLGRRFRALKLWFVIQSYGVEGLKNKIRQHLDLAANFKSWIESESSFELLAPVNFNVICFRYNPGNKTENELNEINAMLHSKLNASGKIFITHTKLNEKYTLRFVIGQNLTERRHVDEAMKLINETANEI